MDPLGNIIAKEGPSTFAQHQSVSTICQKHAFHKWLGEGNAKAGQELWMYLCKIFPLIRHSLTTLGICKEIQLQQSYSQIPSITLKPGLDTVPQSSFDDNFLICKRVSREVHFLVCEGRGIKEVKFYPADNIGSLRHRPGARS